MANLDAPFGLALVGHVDGSPSNARTMKCYIPSSYGTALYVGDPVVFTGTANTAVVNIGQYKHGIGKLPEINKASAGTGNPVHGVIVGFERAVRSSSAPYNPASTEAVAIVCVDRDAIYAIQCDGSLAVTDIGNNANLVYTHSGSATSGKSKAEMNSSGVTTTATLQLKILGVQPMRGRDDISSANCVFKVMINNHGLGNSSAGIN